MLSLLLLFSFEFYCFQCKDVVISPEVERLKTSISFTYSVPVKHIGSPESEMKRRTKPLSGHYGLQNGLKGIVNLGNTCYVSVILQVITTMFCVIKFMFIHHFERNRTGRARLCILVIKWDWNWKMSMDAHLKLGIRSSKLRRFPSENKSITSTLSGCV